MNALDEPYGQLLTDKAEKLEALRRRKPGQKHYKRTLRAYLEADAAAERALIKRIGARPDGSPAKPAR